MKKLKNIKAIFCDLDGTLIPTAHTIDDAPKENADAVHEWIKQGKDFVVATGRDGWFIEDVQRKFGDHLSFISSNGASIFKDGKEVYSNLITKETAQLFLDCAERLEVRDFMMTLTDLSFVAHDLKDISHLQKRKVTRNHQNVTSYIANDTKEIYKIGVSVPVPEAEQLFKQFSECLEPELHVYKSGPHFLEIANKGVNKWEAVKIYCQLMGYDLDEVVVIGDENNDYEMLKNASHSFAMRTGNPQVIEVATYVADSVAEVINEYLLEK